MRAVRWVGLVLAVTVGGPIHAQQVQCRDTELAKKVDALQNDVATLKLTLAELLRSEEMRLAMMRKQITGSAPAPIVSEPIAVVAPPVTVATHVTVPVQTTIQQPPPPRGGGEIVGRVDLSEDVGPDAWVFIEDIVEPAVENATATLKQEAMQFVPRNQVVRKGTVVRFPNLDSIAHNVFSYTPRNNFNLGKYTREEAPRTYRFLVPARVEVFCDIHADMTATILVVPNSYFAKVKDDGTFSLKNVPKGKHTVTAWGARANLRSMRGVEVKPGQTTPPLSFVLERGHDPYNPKHKTKY